MASAAEERIRLKVRAELRRRYPDGRIIDELVIDSFRIRMDVACVMPDRIVIVEIKSERDVLKRLAKQVEHAVKVASAVWVVVAHKHVAKVQAMQSCSRSLKTPIETARGGVRFTEENPDFCAALWQANLMSERDGSDTLETLHRPSREPLQDNAALFGLLWSPERRNALRRMGLATSPEANMDRTLRAAIEHMNGGQLRRAVCAQLRARVFDRRPSDSLVLADPPIPLP